MSRSTVLDPKTDEQVSQEYDLFIKDLRKRVFEISQIRHPIKLPGYMSFILNKEEKTAIIRINVSRRKKDGIETCVNFACENMQHDDSAFEGWAICLKAWLPEKVEKVLLDWADPVPNPNEQCHYNRFLYRILKFRNLYSWFNVVDDKTSIIESFETLFKQTKLINNCSRDQRPEKKGERGENAVEFNIVENHCDSFKKRYNLELADHQLPVGVRSIANNDNSLKEERFFTGGQSCIDLWGYNTENKTISIFELKYSEGKTANAKVGIISELFLYANIIADIISGKIACPDAVRNNEKSLYAEIKKMKCICAYMLSDRYHPLIAYNAKVLDLLNNYNKEALCVDLSFFKDQYSYSFVTETLKLSDL